jgi:D-sorbitol dehydrogenase (acceptor)
MKRMIPAAASAADEPIKSIGEGLQPGEKKRAVGRTVPLGRMGTPTDIAGAALFLASNESASITAQTLSVDGGNWMS